MLQAKENSQGQNEPRMESKSNKIIQEEKSETGYVKLSVFLYYIQACGKAVWLLFLTFFVLSTGME